MSAASSERVPARARVPWFVGFLARRAGWAVVTTLIFVLVVLVVMEVWVPYSWATITTRSPQAEEQVRELLGLNRPLPIRYAEFVIGLARGDLGTSFGGASVTTLIASALPVTITVFMVGTVLGWVVGEALGRIGSWRRSFAAGSVVSVLGVASVAVFPPFLVFVLVRAMREPLLASRELLGLPRDSNVLWDAALRGLPDAVQPTDVWWSIALSLTVAVAAALVVRAIARRQRLILIGGLALPAALIGLGVGVWVSGLGPYALDIMYRPGLPSSTFRPDVSVTIARSSPLMALLGVALLTFGQVSLLMRAGMHAQRSEDYVVTGRAKGVADRVIRDRHAARNAIPPVLAGSFLTFPTVLAGMMIIELELRIEGLSSVMFAAVEAQDVPVITGILVVLGLIGVGFRVVTDIAIAVIDPRRRSARS